MQQRRKTKQQEEEEEAEECHDKLERCPVFAELGECEANAAYMNEYCAYSCDKCGDDEEEEDDPSCIDKEELCGFWAERGECDKNPNYMLKDCAKSCGTCVAKKKKARPAATNQESKSEELSRKSKTFGEAQTADGNKAEETLARIESTIAYMESEEVRKLSHKVRSGCRNRHELCSFWQVSRWFGSSLLLV